MADDSMADDSVAEGEAAVSAGDDPDEELAPAAPESDGVEDLSFLDNLGSGDHDHEEGFDGGLELDDSQAEEVRWIFISSLPQYLEPLEQMIDQLLDTGYDEELQRAATVTLASIADAATRVGIDDVAVLAQDMRDRILLLDEDEEPDAELREGIRRAFKELGDVAGDSSEQGASIAPAARSKTIVAAFNDIEGIDRSVLQRLTAAGLVTVDQLLMAARHEIVAVTGLDAGVVDRLVDALSPETASPVEPMPERVSERPSGPHAELREKLWAQVDAELALDRARSQLLRLRHRIVDYRDELTRSEQRRDELRDELTAARGRMAAELVTLGEERSIAAEHAAAKARDEKELERVERSLARSRREKEAVADELASFAGKVEALTGSVHRIRKS